MAKALQRWLQHRKGNPSATTKPNRSSEHRRVKGHVNEIEDFLEIVVRCHLIAAALNFFAMDSIDDKPKANAFPHAFFSFPIPKKREIVLSKLHEIIDRYVVPKQFSLVQSNQETEVGVTEKDARSNPHYQNIANEHCYLPFQPTAASQIERRHLPSTITSFLERSQASQVVRKASVDGIYEYASAVLNDGLLLFELKDSIREGDGQRILRCWKVMLLYFSFAKHQNYLKEGIRMLATVNGAATPRVAAQITWSRVVNQRGMQGSNIPVDLMNEHLNKSLKSSVSSVGSNITHKTVMQCGQSLHGLQKVCTAFDEQHGLHSETSEHNRPSLAKDQQLMVKELVSSNVFDYIPGRSHSSFHGIKANAAQLVDPSKLTATIEQNKSTLQCEQNVAKLYVQKHS